MTLLCRKTYGHDLGLTATFRQWRAKSHCQYMHGYALAFQFTFNCDRLDENGWVMDFGGLKPLKQWLQDTFDHKTLVAEDDPLLDYFRDMDETGLIQLVHVERTGCEAFAQMAAGECQRIVDASSTNFARRVQVQEVVVSEHGGNSAIWRGRV